MHPTQGACVNVSVYVALAPSNVAVALDTGSTHMGRRIRRELRRVFCVV
jgi:sugar/nucleoside kinase (ribokinase family)